MNKDSKREVKKNRVLCVQCSGRNIARLDGMLRILKVLLEVALVASELVRLLQ